MVSSARFRSPVVVPTAVCLLAAAGLLVVDTLGHLPQPTLLGTGFTLVGAVVALVVFLAARGEPPELGRQIPATRRKPSSRS